MKTALRLFLRDSCEAALAIVVAMQLVMPANVDDAKRTAVTIGTAVLASTFAVFRRVLFPALLEWLSPRD